MQNEAKRPRLQLRRTMNDDDIVSIAQVKAFLKFRGEARFSKTDRNETYEWIGRTLSKLPSHFRRKIVSNARDPSNPNG